MNVGVNKAWLATADGKIIAELDIKNIRYAAVTKDSKIIGAVALNPKVKHEFVFTPRVRLDLIGRECEDE